MNFRKRCWQRRWVRGLAWTAVTLVTLYALLCAWVNWSGARQWSATQAMLKAEGETLDFRATLNDPVPEAENFCAIPLLKDLALAVDDDPNKGAHAEQRKRLEALMPPSGSKGAVRPRLANVAFGKRTDLKAWADWMRKDGSLPMPADSGDAARDVLAALANHDAVVQELAAGLHRPKAQWTPEWKTRELPEMLFAIKLPHYSPIQGLSRTLALRTSAAARAGDAAKAHESALIIARLSQASLNDPFLIGLLVAASGANMLCGVTWELCDAHAGTVEDFTRLEAALTGLDFHRGTLRALRSEMAAGVNALQLMKRKRENSLELLELVNGGSNPVGFIPRDWFARAIPSGFFDASAAASADLEFKYLLKPLRDHGWKEARQGTRDFETELTGMKQRIWTNPSCILASVIAPAMSSIINQVIYTQTLINEAIIACALERHRIANGSYPDSLDAVRLADGKPLPPDPMDGKPMRYRKTTDGRYALWSVGFDGKDDGGKRVIDEKKGESTRLSDEKYVGDWVWDFPGGLE
ncbi:MAG: hypothetical protein ABMA01_17780 [Chthoniobacteraceae bacterium]